MVTKFEKNSNPFIKNIEHYIKWSCTKVVISRLTRAHPPLAGQKFQTPTLLTIRCLYILRNDNHVRVRRWVPITSRALNSQSERFSSARCENLAAAAAASERLSTSAFALCAWRRRRNTGDAPHIERGEQRQKMMIKAISQDTTSAAVAAVAVCATRRVPQHTHIAQTRTLCDMVWKKITKSLGLSQLRCINPDKKTCPAHWK
jgi:hypothetical protein